ncbi:MAG: hypothetical protein EB059_04100 [Alphaproteobacteria bacterium]|nr:hypothetical protein [Alphaproteobacteria bacterium]
MYTALLLLAGYSVARFILLMTVHQLKDLPNQNTIWHKWQAFFEIIDFVVLMVVLIIVGIGILTVGCMCVGAPSPYVEMAFNAIGSLINLWVLAVFCPFGAAFIAIGALISLRAFVVLWKKLKRLYCQQIKVRKT